MQPTLLRACQRATAHSARRPAAPARRLSSLSQLRPATRVKIVEVGPRDGLQNEKSVVPTDVKLELIRRLVGAGLPYIEASSFVSKAWVPQMGDAPELFAGIKAGIKPAHPHVTFSALTPNLKGFEAALATGAVDEVAIFAAASDSFSRRNINCGVIDSFARFAPLVDAARAAGVRVRGYVSCVLGCPYEGPVHPQAVAFVAASLLEMGCYEVSLGDTIGVGTPTGVRALLHSLLVEHRVRPEQTAVHFHATYGSALANILAAVEAGVPTVDSAVGGLGGCPYAAGASGNVPTEDVVYMLHGMGVATGVDFDAVSRVGDWITSYLGRRNESRAGAARVAQLRAVERRAAEDAAKAAETATAAAASPATSTSSSSNSSAAATAAAAPAGGASATPVPLMWPVTWPAGSPAPTVLLDRHRQLAEEEERLARAAAMAAAEAAAHEFFTPAAVAAAAAASGTPAAAVAATGEKAARKATAAA